VTKITLFQELTKREHCVGTVVRPQMAQYDRSRVFHVFAKSILEGTAQNQGGFAISRLSSGKHRATGFDLNRVWKSGFYDIRDFLPEEIKTVDHARMFSRCRCCKSNVFSSCRSHFFA